MEIGKNVIFWGCGKIAMEMYSKYQADFTLAYSISNDSKETVFTARDGKEYPVKKPEKKKKKPEGTIIICSIDYEKIAEQLALLGYVPFVDFIDYELADIIWSGRKTALFYGFCHLRGIAECLKETKIFSRMYATFYVPSYLPLHFYRQSRLRYLAVNCDVFIYGMELSQENYRKNSALLEGLKPGTKTMRLHAAYFGGYFPQKKRAYNTMNELAVKCDRYDYTPFSYGDSWLNDCIMQEMSIDDILNQIMHREIYTRDFILKYIEGEWKRLRYQEGESDFKIVDYLEKNYGTRRLFRNESHMENEVIVQYAEQILQCLGLSRGVCVPEKPLLNCSQHFIYPCVAEALGLGWNVWEEKLELYTYAGWRMVSTKEFIRLYYESCSETLRLKKSHLLP